MLKSNPLNLYYRLLFKTDCTIITFMVNIEGSFKPGVAEEVFADAKTDGLTFRDVTPEDADTVGEFLIREGRTDINPLPDTFVSKHVRDIAASKTEGVIAELAGKPIGVFTYEVHQPGGPYSKFQPSGQEDAPYGYLAEAVTKQGLVRHLGTMLCETALHKVRAKGVHVAYSIHNTENIASGLMMLYNGMGEVSILHQPERGRDMSVKSIILPPRS